MTLGQASIDTDDVAAHLADSTFTGNELWTKLNAVRVLERRVVAGSATGPAAIGDALFANVELWREHDGRLRTILDALATGPTGLVTIPTDELRDRVAAINGPINGGTYEIHDDGLDIIIDGGIGGDTIDVTQNPDGTTTVVINGDTIEFAEDESDDLHIGGGGGNDTITVDPYRQRFVTTPGGPVAVGDEARGLRIDGGAGNDIINGGTGDDHIVGGAGRDSIYGGLGDDKLEGDAGFDTLYGGAGDDYLIGGDHDDYLDGGRGDDVVSGRGGNDIVAGGDGDDSIFGGNDDDVLITGRGQDTVYDGTGNADQVFAQTEDTLHVDATTAGNVEIVEVYDPDTSQIRVTGTTEERDRIQSDLDTLASIPEGAAVLRSLDENPGGHTVTIGIDATDGSSASPASSDGTYEIGGVTGHDRDGTLNPDVGQDGTVSYNPSATRIYDGRRPYEDWHDTPPVVILHHELLHTEDYVYGARDPGESAQVVHDGTGGAVTGPGGGPPIEMTLPGGRTVPAANNRELSVVGLPFDENDEANDDPVSTPGEVDPNNRQHTENSLRDQLGLPRRRYY